MTSPPQTTSLVDNPNPDSNSASTNPSRIIKQSSSAIKNLTIPAKLARNPPSTLDHPNTDQLYTALFKSHISNNRLFLNRSKTETEFSLNSSSSSNSSSDSSKLSPKHPGAVSAVSLGPLFPTYTDALSDSLKKLNSSQKPAKHNQLLNPHRSRSITKKKVSSPLSINDYSNIINMNTGHQMLIDFIKTSHRDSNAIAANNKKLNGRAHKSLTPASTQAKLEQKTPIQQMFLNTYIQVRPERNCQIDGV